MKKNSCRLCQRTDLVMFLDLGFHPHSDQFRKDVEGEEVYYPLRLVQCQNCQFVQLDYVVDPEVLYTKDYLYESSITKTAGKHWEEFVDSVLKNVVDAKTVVDIGSNDGTLLSKFKERGLTVQGIDPCPEVVKIANDRGIPTIEDFFNKRSVDKVGKKIDLITGSNVFAHIDDLDDVMVNVKSLLSDNGVFIFESPYLGEFLKGLEYDTVYHQHLSYLALKPLKTFFAKHGMEVWNVETSDIHGGCFRCYISKIGERTISPSVDELANKEDFNLNVLKTFAKQVELHRLELMTTLYDLKKQGKTIGIVSAPAKGMSLMNYCKIDKALVDFITEKSKLKIGRYTPGSHIKIEPDAVLTERQPDYALLLAWNFAKEIIKNNPDYKGTWIVPLPTIQLIKNE